VPPLATPAQLPSTLIPTPIRPETLAAGLGSLWSVSSVENKLARIDPASGQVTGTWTYGGALLDVVANKSAVFVTGYDDSGQGVLHVIDRNGQLVKTHHLDGTPGGVTASESRVFMMVETRRAPDFLTESLQSIDPTTGRIAGSQTFRFPGALQEAHRLSVVGSNLWLVGGARLIRLDATSLKISKQFNLPYAAGTVLATSDGAVYVSAGRGSGPTMRIKPGDGSVQWRTDAAAYALAEAHGELYGAVTTNPVRINAATGAIDATAALPPGTGVTHEIAGTGDYFNSVVTLDGQAWISWPEIDLIQRIAVG
jgi:hypothetical protein